MSLGQYVKDKIIIILMNVIGLFLLSIYLLAVGNSGATVFVICIIWTVAFLISFLVVYRDRKRYFDKINELMEHLDQPCLIQELMEHSWHLEDQLYRDILKKSNKAVIERIHLLESEQKEYREFIEGWIHEVKLPITGIRLVSHGLAQESRGRIESYLTELDKDVEQALFYARSDQVYKDYMIQETELKSVIHNVLKKDKHLLIQNEMSAQVECDGAAVYTDGKWLEFILRQILANAVKYKKAGSGTILFKTEALESGVKLTVRDNGSGVPKSEQGRIFEKGFTGTNGRKKKSYTYTIKGATK